MNEIRASRTLKLFRLGIRCLFENRSFAERLQCCYFFFFRLRNCGAFIGGKGWKLCRFFSKVRGRRKKKAEFWKMLVREFQYFVGSCRYFFFLSVRKLSLRNVSKLSGKNYELSFAAVLPYSFFAPPRSDDDSAALPTGAVFCNDSFFISFCILPLAVPSFGRADS